MFDKKAYQKEWNKRPENRERQKLARKRWHAKPGVMEYLAAKKREQNATERGKLQQKNRQLKMRYALDIDAYATMLQAQDFKCAICKTPVNPGITLSVDHNHKTGKVRALLCMHCNHGLGKFKDDPALLEKAAAYLREHVS